MTTMNWMTKKLPKLSLWPRPHHAIGNILKETGLVTMCLDPRWPLTLPRLSTMGCIIMRWTCGGMRMATIIMRWAFVVFIIHFYWGKKIKGMSRIHLAKKLVLFEFIFFYFFFSWQKKKKRQCKVQDFFWGVIAFWPSFVYILGGALQLNINIFLTN